MFPGLCWDWVRQAAALLAVDILVVLTVGPREASLACSGECHRLWVEVNAHHIDESHVPSKFLVVGGEGCAVRCWDITPNCTVRVIVTFGVASPMQCRRTTIIIRGSLSQGMEPEGLRKSKPPGRPARRQEQCRETASVADTSLRRLVSLATIAFLE